MLKFKLFVLLLPLWLSNVATAQTATPQTYDIFILGGGKTQADADAALHKYQQSVFYLRYGHSASAYPGTLSSASIPGLKPGFFIAVAGLCAHSEHNKAERTALLKTLQAAVKGSYVREIKGQYGDPCPEAAALAQPGSAEAKLRAAIVAAPTSTQALYQYAAFLDAEARFVEAQAFVDKILQLDAKHAAAQALSEKLMVLMTD